MLELILPDWNVADNIKAVVTTRVGGFSQSPYGGFNLATHVGDNLENVKQNRQYLKQQLNLPDEPVWLNQTHSVNVIDAGQNSSTLTEADASFSFKPNVVCAVLTADCLPVFFTNQQGTKVAVAHAGWRGLCDGVLEKIVLAMQEDSQNIIAWLGPAIGTDSFEVKEDVKTVFIKKHPQSEKAFVEQNSGKYLANIYHLAKVHLNAIGVDNISGGGFDTMTDKRFFSYRQNAETGRMASLIWREK